MKKQMVLSALVGLAVLATSSAEAQISAKEANRRFAIEITWLKGKFAERQGAASSRSFIEWADITSNMQDREEFQDLLKEGDYKNQVHSIIVTWLSEATSTAIAETIQRGPLYNAPLKRCLKAVNKYRGKFSHKQLETLKIYLEEALEATGLAAPVEGLQAELTNLQGQYRNLRQQFDELTRR